jgi:vancomycin resistance protein YoaR
VKRSTIATIAAVVGATLLILPGSTIAGYELASWNRVKPGVTVLNIDVGGLTLDEAQARLAPRALAIMDQPVQLQLGEVNKTWTTTARQLGVKLDPAELASSAYAIGREPAPLTAVSMQLNVLQVGDEVPVVGQADGAMLDALVRQVAHEVDKPARDAQLTLNDDGTQEFTTSAEGLQLDQAPSRAAIAQALASGTPQVTLTAHPVKPHVRTDQVAAAHDQLGRILDPHPIQISALDYSRSLDTSDILQLVTLNQPQGSNAASITVNTDALQPLIDGASKALDQQPVNARFAWDGAHLTVLRSSKDGRAVDQQASLQALTDGILQGARSIQLPVNTVAAPVSSTDGGASLGISQLIEQSTTSFAGSVPEKAHNIKLAAQRLNGVVVPPGGTFSFNDQVGPTTLEAGFQWGFGLTTGSNGGAHTVPSVAGGICQVATTLFQPVFWAGYQLEERYWHLYWIPAYTSRDVVGLDATVDEDAGLDFKWINPTSDYVLVQASTDTDHVTFSLYGKKPNWKVQVEQPMISNRVSPDTTPDVQAEPLLPWGRVVPVETARDGFQVVITRHVIGPDGSDERDLVLKSIYQPGHNVTLVGSANAPDAATVTAAIDRVRGSMQPAGAPAPPTPTIDTANGPKTLTQIRDELRQAGWGGGSDQDAVDTYRRLADAAAH